MASRLEITEVVQDTSGNTISGASYTATDLNGGALTVYTTETGSATVSDFSSDDQGRIEGWVEAPDYNLNVTSGSATYTQNIRTSPPGVFNVKSYGAGGAGATSDDACFAACFLAGAGKSVEIPIDDYTLASALTVADSTEVFGHGRASNVQFSGTGSFITFTGTPRCTFRNFRLQLTSAATSATLLTLSNAFLCSFHNVWFIGQNTAASGATYLSQTGVETTSNAGQNDFVQCRITNMGTGFKAGSLMNTFTGSQIVTCRNGIASVGSNNGLTLTGVHLIGDGAAGGLGLYMDGTSSEWYSQGLWAESWEVAVRNGTSGVSSPIITTMYGAHLSSNTNSPTGICFDWQAGAPTLDAFTLWGAGVTTPDGLKVDAGVSGGQLGLIRDAISGHPFDAVTDTSIPNRVVKRGRLTMKVGGSNFDYDTGDFRTQVAGGGISIKEGTNAKMGRATLVAGTVVVSTTKTSATSEIFLTCQTPGGTPGFLRVSARTAGTSFTILSSSGTDTSVVGWLIVEPS